MRIAAALLSTTVALTVACGRGGFGLTGAPAGSSTTGQYPPDTPATTTTASGPVTSTVTVTSDTGDETSSGTTGRPPPPPDLTGTTSDSVGTTGNPPPPVACPGTDDRGSILWDVREPGLVLDWSVQWRAVSASPTGDVIRAGSVDTSEVDALVGGLFSDGSPWFEDQHAGLAGADDLATDVEHDVAGHAFVAGLEQATGSGEEVSGSTVFLLRYDPGGMRQWTTTFPAPPGWRYGMPGVGATDQGVTVVVMRQFSANNDRLEAIAVDDDGQEIDRRVFAPPGPSPWMVAAVAGRAGRVVLGRNGGSLTNPSARAVEVLHPDLSTAYETELPQVDGVVRDVAISEYGQVTAVGRSGGEAWWIYRIDPDGAPGAIDPDVAFPPAPFGVRAVTMDCEGNAVVSGEGDDGPWATSYDPLNQVRWSVSFGGHWAGRLQDHAADGIGDLSVVGHQVEDNELYVTRLAGG